MREKPEFPAFVFCSFLLTFTKNISVPTLSEKLRDYEDFELAFLLRYKSKSYTEDTRNHIIVELAARGIDSEDILNRLISEKLKENVDTFMNTRCPRCTSDKIISIREEDYDSRVQVVVDFPDRNTPKYRIRRQCAVCGWDFTNDTEPGTDIFTSIGMKLFIRIGIALLVLLIIIFLIAL